MSQYKGSREVDALRAALTRALDAECVLFKQYDDDPGEFIPEWLQRDADAIGLDWLDCKARWRRDLNERAALAALNPHPEKP
jgi:hypothetical protein